MKKFDDKKIYNLYLNKIFSPNLNLNFYISYEMQIRQEFYKNLLNIVPSPYLVPYSDKIYDFNLNNDGNLYILSKF